jgi:hypothetical protein
MPTHIEFFCATTFSPERFSAERPPSPVTAAQPALVLHEQVQSKLAGGPAMLLLEMAVAMVTVVGVFALTEASIARCAWARTHA